MDQKKTTQWKKLSRGECSQAGHSTKENTHSRTDMPFQANKSTHSDHNDKDVFLSHSSKQKNFVRQLYTDLTNQGLSCFFDQDPDSLPLAENFPAIIFEAAKTCSIAVLLLSKDFLESKWPMQELAAFVEARDTSRENGKPKILPLFFLISPDALKEKKVGNEKWKQLGISVETQAKWLEALKAIRPINGINFRNGDDEVDFRVKVVKEIWRILPPLQRYHIPNMKGGERMCQEVTDFFNTVRPNRNGILIAGLYGIAGHGKTSLGQAFCNFKLTEFEGKVCHLELSRGDKDDSFKRKKLALRYLTHYPQSGLETLTKDQAEAELHERLRGKRVLLVLDNITEETVDEVGYYIRADLREDSYIRLSARSADLLVKHFKIDSRSCMHVPSLEEEEAIAILLEKAFPEVSTLGAEVKDCVLKCANRCLFRCDTVRRGRTFHPLALKAFGSHLFSKYDCNLSEWVADIDGLQDRSGYGLDDVFNALRNAFDDMHPKYRTIFMLLTIYMPPNMSPHKVTEWLAIICNQEISFVNKAVEDLCKKAFIEEFEPEIRIHDLYIEFAQSTADKMRKWLLWKGDGSSRRALISEDQAGFELAKLEQCTHREPSEMEPSDLKNLLLLQLVGVQNMSQLDFSPMRRLRSFTLQNCKDLATLEGMENLVQLAWLQISKVNPIFKLPKISSLKGLQHLEIDIAVLQAFGDLTPCKHLRDINVRCPSLPEFPRLNGLPHLEKVEFSACGEVKGFLDCTNCVMLQSIVLNGCCKMATSPVLAGCKKLEKIVLSDCDEVIECPDIDVADDESSALKTLELSISSKAASAPRSLESCDKLENLHLWNMEELKKLPSFNCLSNLTVLKIGKCGITNPPDLTCCLKLENVYFFTLKNLKRFPNFSLLRKLKILNLYNCRRVQDPPDISCCHELQVFHLVCNDNMKGLPEMHECPELDEIKVSWHCEGEVIYEGIDPHSWEVDANFQSCLEHFKDEIPVENFDEACVPIELRKWLEMQEKRWMHARTMLVKKYFRGLKLYCSVMAAYESYESSNSLSKNNNTLSKNNITLRLVNNEVAPFPTLRTFSEDNDWFTEVAEYFASKKYIGSISLPNSEVVAFPTSGGVSKDRGFSNKVQECFAGRDCGWINKMQVCFARKDYGWLNKVQKCFVGEDCRGMKKMQVCLAGKDCGSLNKLQDCFAGNKDALVQVLRQVTSKYQF
ncbi:hypothetical protein SUGI_0868880 [Cryptomeria japonica]|nr:hypothetical protein SUGI_0868880 [Cryptomeria japonica]